MVNDSKLISDRTLNLVSDINGSRLLQLNESDCTCLGYTQTFQCNVVGRGFTIWNGTFFECQNEIKLRHSQYNNIEGMTPGPPYSECNHGAVVAKSIGSYDNLCYTSQLSVVIGEEMINKTIECIHDDLEERIIIGQKSLATTEIPPPNNVHIEVNDSHQITFAWDEVTIQCSSLRYIITAINCGVCPNTTADKNITCNIQSDISLRTNDTCLFAVQTQICGHLLGEKSDIVLVHIDGE